MQPQQPRPQHQPYHAAMAVAVTMATAVDSLTTRTTERPYVRRKCIIYSAARSATAARRKQFADCATSSQLGSTPSVIISDVLTTPFLRTHFHCACAESAIFLLPVLMKSSSVIIRAVRLPAAVTGTRARAP